MTYFFIKRFIDLAVATFLLIGLSPILGIISLRIWLYDRGAIFYKAPRVGKDSLLFKMYKFRTMVLNADKIGASSTAEDDPRITPVGRFLRKYKLDELPQLINVLNGSMSLVGPRPQVKWAVDLYTADEKEVLTVKPGITDYASVYFPNEGELLKGSSDPDKEYMEKIHPIKMRLCLKYVRERSLFTDINIMRMTALAVFGLHPAQDSSIYCENV